MEGATPAVLTIKSGLVEWLKLPLAWSVAVTPKLKLPVLAVAWEVTTKVVEMLPPFGTTGFVGEKVQEALLGQLPTLAKFTAPLNPLSEVKVIVKEVDCPWVIV
jgi:hypothetical protein